MIALVERPIDVAALIEQVQSRRAGAVCLFLGTVREITGDRQTLWLEYEAYPAMARAQLDALEVEARRQWPIQDMGVIHRVGRLALGDVAVAIAVSCPHRREAFAACQWLIDSIKTDVPIWKKEIWADGAEEWVHPRE